ncbi:MAG TPA: LuxR C-terminal-related transcriptional regulator [Nakamurella sp.]|jgi:DNA-binding CsgD family transcriptional regulator
MADLRLRQGRIEETETPLNGCHDGLLAAKLRLARGEPEVAIALLQRLSEGLRSPADTATVLALLVQAQLAATGPAATTPTLDRLAALSATHPVDNIAAHNVIAGGRVALARGDLDLATARLQTGAGILARLDLPLDIAELNLTLARAHAPGSPQLAVAEAQSALTALDELGATALADSAAALLRSLGAPGRRSPRTTDALTKREQQVLQLVGLGMSNPEIARRLFISPKTAAHHVSRVLGKLGLRSRAEAAAHWSRTGDRQRR